MTHCRALNLEDIINLLNGRDSLESEIAAAKSDVREYISQEFKELIEHPDFEYAVLGNLGDTARSELLFQRMDRIIRQDEHQK